MRSAPLTALAPTDFAPRFIIIGAGAGAGRGRSSQPYHVREQETCR
jgi:hypothetical protein